MFRLFAGSTRQIIQKSQSDAEETIENWRQADEQATREAHDTATVQCAELTDFGGRLRDQIRASDQAVSILVQKQFKRDLPTGTKKIVIIFFLLKITLLTIYRTNSWTSRKTIPKESCGWYS